MQNIQKSLILITGIPASGKTEFSKVLNQILTTHDKKCLILSIDKIQAIIYDKKTEKINLNNDSVINFLIQTDWIKTMSYFQLNKLKFDAQIWKQSRQVAENYNLLNYLIQNCQILIIEDQKPLKSQRKPYKKYCFQRQIKYLQIQLLIQLDEALQNNKKRPQMSSVSEQVIRKSYQKFQHNVQALQISLKSLDFLVTANFILSNLKKVHIQDNYSQQLNKKLNNLDKKIEFSQKQLNENQLRKLITKIMNDQKQQQQYFKNYLHRPITKKDKAQILANAKKIYIENKRTKNFKMILNQYIQQKNDNK